MLFIPGMVKQRPKILNRVWVIGSSKLRSICRKSYPKSDRICLFRFCRSLVFGGFDGIISSLVIISGATGK